jgi:undecaprenyl-diphosphatase
VPLLVALGGDHVTVQLIKHLVARPRPGADIAYYLETSSSFPSGNSAIAVVLYGFLAYAAAREVPTRTRRAAIALAGLLMALALGLSRVYRGVHFLTDVLAGYLVGLLWLIIGIRLAKALRPGPSAAGGVGPRPTRARLAMTSAVIVVALVFCAVFAARHVRPRAVADDPSAVTDSPTARE